MNMFCNHCGKSVEEDSQFCIHCGQKILRNEPILESPVNASSTIKAEGNLKGISGWLILPAIGLVIAPLLIFSSFFTTFLPLFSDGSFENIRQTSPGLANLVIFEMVFNSILIVALIYLNVIFYQKKKFFPRYFIMYLIVSVAFVFIDYFIAVSVSSSVDTSDLGRPLIGAFIWIPYFLKSKRVKAS